MQVGTSSTHHAAQLSPSRASTDSRAASSSSKIARASAHAPRARAALPSWTRSSLETISAMYRTVTPLARIRLLRGWHEAATRCDVLGSSALACWDGRGLAGASGDLLRDVCGIPLLSKSANLVELLHPTPHLPGLPMPRWWLSRVTAVDWPWGVAPALACGGLSELRIGRGCTSP